uniref:Sec-independent protein translocase component TatC n=1 Tax=Gredgaria maugeana TaxID=2007213 RepID=UPI0022FDA7D8|nr:Sec-independent protein translocase component TatC [Gredgaria maugeana]WAX04222.1 Sec-independent protein translocase component TatC [Gredgaria maugeana]
MSFLLKELTFLFRYFSFSLFFLFILSFKKFPLILLFFFYPIGKVFKKKLIILHVGEFVNISFFLNLTISCFILIIFLIFLIKVFFSSSWYNTQNKLFENFLKTIFLVLICSFTVFYFLYFSIFNFSLLWNFETFNSFHLFDIQLQVFKFLKFQLFNLNLICFVISVFGVGSLVFRWFFSWKFIFFIFRKIKLFLFLSFSFFSFFFSDITFIFFFLLIFFLLILEIIFIFICWKLY